MLGKDAKNISQIDQHPWYPWHVFTCHDCASAYKKSPPNSRILPLVSGCIPKWSLGTSNPNQKLSFPLDFFWGREVHFADLFFEVQGWISVCFGGALCRWWFKKTGSQEGWPSNDEHAISSQELGASGLPILPQAKKDASLNHNSAESSRCAMICSITSITF